MHIKINCSLTASSATFYVVIVVIDEVIFNKSAKDVMERVSNRDSGADNLKQTVSSHVM